MGLLKAELYKLFCDKQIKFVILIIVLYLVYSFFGLEKPIDTSFEGWLISNTTDSVFMLFFIGIVAATVFTIDYSNKTYKNFPPVRLDFKQLALALMSRGVFSSLCRPNCS